MRNGVTNASHTSGRTLADALPGSRRVVPERSPRLFRRLRESRADLALGKNFGPLEREIRICNAVTNTSRNGGRNAAPTRPDPTRPISIGCGWSFTSNVFIRFKTSVGRQLADLELGATR